MTSRAIPALRRFFTSLYFSPDKDDFGTPADRGAVFENVFFPSASGRLHGFLVRAKGEPRRGTILHCHGNAGNVTSHFPFVLFLADAGYDVLVFDYAGFGQSEGRRSSLPGIEEDARAALAYLLSRPDVDASRVAVFGQSLGGAAAAAAATHPAVKAIILEATFTTYRQMARATFVGRILFALVPVVIPEGGPATHLAGLAPRPILLLHGEADRMVPVRFSRRLQKMAPQNTRLVTLPNVQHLVLGDDETPTFADDILRFLEATLPR